ncbi:hypothetical protein GCM10007385_07630 [Tateyamaria omphalii]|uniref:hypothetical protein n=1 Tax=Tateyamaria omphalii TaxID=299262 RepID=UPI0016723408|nr:hypothetical protein [Tateyamaria omphalii]GGX42443.1 hypothetical protein GCM10007385_07630 [Tateyamaria omphalii]
MTIKPKFIPEVEAPQGPLTARDVIDFHLRWDEFRPVAKSIHGLLDLSQDQAEALYWLIELSDRVHQEDLK